MLRSRDLLVYFSTMTAWGVPHGFTPFSAGSVVVSAVGDVIAAAAGLFLLAWLTRRVVSVFTGLAVAITLLSLLGPVQAMAGAMPGLPAATPETGATMIVLHLLTGGLIAWLLPRQTLK